MTAVGCIIPDDNIEVEPPRTNEGAVRIVHSVGLTEEAVEACQRVPILGEAESQRETCPLPPETLQPGLIRSERGQNFCVCQDDFFDDNALGFVDIHVEDADVDSKTGEPTDDIFGAFLLDVDLPSGGQALTEDDLRAAVAYENYLNPNEPAQLVQLGAGSYEEPIGRPRTNLKSWRLGVDLVDLCNDNDGAKLEGGPLHSLRLVVTDRPWYVPVAVNKDGQPLMDGDKFARQEVDPLLGVPDLPGGASYDVANYTFECLTEEVDAEVSVCNCVDPTGDE